LAVEFAYYALSASTVLVPAPAIQFMDAPAVYNGVYLNAIVMFICLLFGFTGLTNQRLQLRLVRAAHHDALTGALNRHALDAVLQKELAESDGRAPLSVVVLDLDHFKQLNDRFGHQLGDEALRLFADAARSNLRQSDVLGRTGGEEFCLVLPRTDSATANRIAERLRQVVAAIDLPGAPAARLTVSAGIATSAAHRVGDWNALLKAADDALYAAKRGGRNRVIAAPSAPCETAE
jgi:diguanylate cyclase (GGDEF)-like protein